MSYLTTDKCMSAIEDYIKDFAMHFNNCKILDIGCGMGDHTKIFCINNNEVYGLDIEDWRDYDVFNLFKFIKYGGELFPFADKTFDLVVSFDVIEHVKNEDRFVSEIRRVLKDNGRILIGTPNRQRLSNLLSVVIFKPVKFPRIMAENGPLGKLVHIREYAGEELHNLFFNHDFSDTKIDYFWLGLRGKINFGFNLRLFKKFKQYLFIKN